MKKEGSAISTALDGSVGGVRVRAARRQPDRAQRRQDPGAGIGTDRDDAAGRVEQLMAVVVVPLDPARPREAAPGQLWRMMAGYRHYLVGYY
jgi:hypothetical protein